MQREKVMAEIINFAYVTILFLFLFHVTTISGKLFFHHFQISLSIL